MSPRPRTIEDRRAARLRDVKQENGAQSDRLHHLRTRTERLARRLLTRQLGSPADGYRFQTDLLALQRESQAAITGCNRRHDREEIESLRKLLWHSRRLGDAFAFAMLEVSDSLILAQRLIGSLARGNCR